MYSKQLECVFSLNVKDTNICPCLHDIILFYDIYNCLSTSPIRMRICSWNSKHDSFLCKNDEYTYPKGRALKQMNRVVLQTKIVNILYNDLSLMEVRWSVKNVNYGFDIDNTSTQCSNQHVLECYLLFSAYICVVKYDVLMVWTLHATVTKRIKCRKYQNDKGCITCW